jgi:hypothetical protein
MDDVIYLGIVSKHPPRLEQGPRNPATRPAQVRRATSIGRPMRPRQQHGMSEADPSPSNALRGETSAREASQLNRPNVASTSERRAVRRSQRRTSKVHPLRAPSRKTPVPHNAVDKMVKIGWLRGSSGQKSQQVACASFSRAGQLQYRLHARHVGQNRRRLREKLTRVAYKDIVHNSHFRGMTETEVRDKVYSVLDLMLGPFMHDGEA